MAEKINWDEVNEKYNNFKDYAPIGKYTVKLDKAECVKTKNGTLLVQFTFKNPEEYQYPTITRSIMRNNKTFCYHHFRCLFQVFGAETEEKARKAVQQAEDKDEDQAVCEEYARLFNVLNDKTHKDIEIEVYDEYNESTDKTYSHADFLDSRVHFKRDDASKKTEDPLNGAEEAPELSGKVPF